MRARIRTQFGELHAERDQLQAQLGTLTAAGAPKAADTTLLDELPLAGDILPGLPGDLKARLFEVFDLHILWNNKDRQAIIWAEITDATLRALPAILNPGHDMYDDTSEQASDHEEVMGDLFESSVPGGTRSPSGRERRRNRHTASHFRTTGPPARSSPAHDCYNMHFLETRRLIT